MKINNGSGGAKWERHLLQGRHFRSQMYFYYTIRAAHIYIYLAPGGNTPCSATGIHFFNGGSKGDYLGPPR